MTYVYNRPASVRHLKFARFVDVVEQVAQPQTESPTITGFAVNCDRCDGRGKVEGWGFDQLGIVTAKHLGTCPRCRGSRIGQYWRWRRGWTLRT